MPQCLELLMGRAGAKVTIFKQVQPGSPSGLYLPHKEHSAQWRDLLQHLRHGCGLHDEEAFVTKASAWWEEFAHTEAMDLFGRVDLAWKAFQLNRGPRRTCLSQANSISGADMGQQANQAAQGIC